MTASLTAIDLWWRRIVYTYYGPLADGPESEFNMDREKALELLAEVHTDERFAGVLGKVQMYAAGRTATREYWIVRVARLEQRHPQWTYCDTPGDFHRMQQEANGA